MTGYSLRATSGAAAGTVIPVESPLTIGRDSEGLGRLEGDTQLSGRHARIYPHEGRAVIEDLGSTNGTFVNEERIAQPRYLQAGDTVRVGTTVFVAEVPGAETKMGTQVAPQPVPPAAPRTPPPTPQPPVAARSASPAAPPPSAPAGSSGSGRSPLLLVAAIAAVLLVGGGVAAALLLGGDDEDKKEKVTTTDTPPESTEADPAEPEAPATERVTDAPEVADSEVPPDTREPIRSTIAAFLDASVNGDTTNACAQTTEDFTLDSEPADCAEYSETITDDPVTLTKYGVVESDQVVVAATNDNSQDEFVLLMVLTDGEWLISDIAPL